MERVEILNAVQNSGHAVADKATDFWSGVITEDPTKTVLLCAALTAAAGGAILLSALRGEGARNSNESSNKKPQG